jgi:alpha-mannosidase
VQPSDQAIRRRVDRFLWERVRPAIHRDRMPLAVSAWTAPGEPVPFAEARSQTFKPFRPGTPWGPPWGTTWFHLTAPDDLAPRTGAELEILVDLGFTDATPGFQAEGMVFDADGRILKGLHSYNHHVPLGSATGQIDLWVEAAANPDVTGGWSYSPTPLGSRETAGSDPLYVFRSADLTVLDREVWQLAQDVWTLRGLLDELDVGSTRHARILRALDGAVDAADPQDVSGSARKARATLTDALSAEAHRTAHQVYAVGHAHIDSAWLWPVRETIRKCARTFSNVLQLMSEDPDLVFAASSAQQYEWMKEHYPALYARIADRVVEGRFIPVGGMWVEADTNMPGGEALVRQFLLGSAFFRSEFGVESPVVWLPDSFGYTAALPQIIAGTGARYFLTQKPSWNDTNVMPHHWFRWQGIDGTSVLTHLPPVNTYCSDLSAPQLAAAERRFADKATSSASLVPFGWGDGGGGPTREMLAAAERKADLEGSPAVRIAGPAEFFEAAEAENSHPPIWSGEMYLEFHRGTYTSQAATKRGNRRCEHLLREAEAWATTAAVLAGADYPYDELTRAWKTVLLQQFHDILPGSSIAWVHREAEANYARVEDAVTLMVGRALERLVGRGDTDLAANATSFEISGVPTLAVGAPKPRATVTASRDGSSIVLSNERLLVTIDSAGLIVRIRDRVAAREVIPAGEAGNLLVAFRDTPAQWDAWDIDMEYARHPVELRAAASVELGHDEAGPAVRVVRTYGSSSFTQRVWLDDDLVRISTSVDWHERETLLKLAFPLDVQADRAASEVQFGHVYRATHANTSWDAARFETCAHRWVHVEEPGYGVAVANDRIYGHDITRAVGRHGPHTLVRQSLLRAPLFPDPEADQGRHDFETAIAPGSDLRAAVAAGQRINLPLRRVRGAGPSPAFLMADRSRLVVETVKLAEDRSGDVVVRLYEPLGASGADSLRLGFPVERVAYVDLLERPVDVPPPQPDTDGSLPVALRPFQIATLRLTPRHGR